MYALTIKHPWAWAIAQGLKDYENRVWRPLATLEGYEIAIHAGKSLDKEGERAFQEIMSYLEIPLPTAHQLHFGAIIGTARLGKTVTVGADAPASPWLFGPYGLPMLDAVAIDPVPCRGMLGLWMVPPPEAAEVARRVAAVRNGEPQRTADWQGSMGF